MPDEEETLNRVWPISAQVGELWGSHRALEKAFRAHEIWDEKKFDEVRDILKGQDSTLDSIHQILARMEGSKAMLGILARPAWWIITSIVSLMAVLANHFLFHW